MAHPIGTRDLLIKGGRIIDPSQGLDTVGDVLLRNGVVEACGGALGTPDGAEVIDATGLIVAPGFIDVHVHLREPGREDVETVASGAHSAVAMAYAVIACPAACRLTPIPSEMTDTRPVVTKAEDPMTRLPRARR